MIRKMYTLLPDERCSPLQSVARKWPDKSKFDALPVERNQDA